MQISTRFRLIVGSIYSNWGLYPHSQPYIFGHPVPLIYTSFLIITIVHSLRHYYKGRNEFVSNVMKCHADAERPAVTESLADSSRFVERLSQKHDLQWW